MIRVLVPVAALAGCGAPSAPLPEVAPGEGSGARVLPSGTPGNVLVILLDDVSQEHVEAYGAVLGQPHTPTISTLASVGMTFTNGYAFPTCSPARGALLTGRFPSRYGIGNPLQNDDPPRSLPLAEVTLPEALRSSPYGYTSALVGKWHLNALNMPAARTAPIDQGFDYASGTIANPADSVTDTPGLDYFRWERVTNGRPEIVDEYLTTVTADDVVYRTRAMPEPWFLLAAFNAPHVPYHVPPERLVHHPPRLSCEDSPPSCFTAMVEAADTEIGRMLSEMDPAVLARTTIVLTADNGTASESIRPPFDPARGKGTLYDGGVRVPFIVAGPWVSRPGSRSDAFVSLVDLFATITELTEVPALTSWDGTPLRTDSVSFLHLLDDPTAAALPPRDLFVYAEGFQDVGPPPYYYHQRMVRTADAKLIRENQDDMQFDYDGTTEEGDDLMQGGAPPKGVSADTMVLTDIMDAVESTLVYEGP